MKWEAEDIRLLRERLAKIDAWAEEYRVAESEERFDRCRELDLMIEAEHDWTGPATADFARDILDAFDAMEREGLVLTRVQSWPAELPLDHPGDSHWEVQRRIPGPRYEVVARGDAPLEALLAAAATLEGKSDG